MNIDGPGIYLTEEGERLRIVANEDPNTCERFPWVGTPHIPPYNWRKLFDAAGKRSTGDLSRRVGDLPVVQPRVRPVVPAEPETRKVGLLARLRLGW